MDTWVGNAIMVLLVRQIILQPLPGETATSRLKQIGMMTLIFALHGSENPITLSTLVSMSGLTRGGVSETIDQLVRRELLFETMGHNVIGRGRARLFVISPGVLRKAYSITDGEL
ncbi:transcriptional regulator [Xanthobacter sp. AM33]